MSSHNQKRRLERQALKWSANMGVISRECPEASTLLRQRLYSKQYWILLTFVAGEIQANLSIDGVEALCREKDPGCVPGDLPVGYEKVEWPCFRIPENAGKGIVAKINQAKVYSDLDLYEALNGMPGFELSWADNIRIVFVKKDTVSAAELTEIFNRYAASPVTITDDLDVLPMSWGFRNCLVRFLDQAIRTSEHVDN